MLLRRITEHVKSQNWFAVFLDFAIVVVGVFIGIQVANWNTAHSQRQDYKAALERFATEIDANLSDLAEVEDKSLRRLATVRKGFDTLLSCEDSPENRRIVEAGIARIIGAYGVDIRTTSLRELTESPALLAQQSAAERKVLNDTRIRIDFLLSEGDYFENLPLEMKVVQHSMIALGSRKPAEWGLFTNERVHVPDLHALVLAAPLDVACKDDALLKAFYTWEHWQGIIPNLARGIQETLEESRKELNL